MYHTVTRLCCFLFAVVMIATASETGCVAAGVEAAAVCWPFVVSVPVVVPVVVVSVVVSVIVPVVVVSVVVVVVVSVVSVVVVVFEFGANDYVLFDATYTPRTRLNGQPHTLFSLGAGSWGKRPKHC